MRGAHRTLEASVKLKFLTSIGSKRISQLSVVFKLKLTTDDVIQWCDFKNLVLKLKSSKHMKWNVLIDLEIAAQYTADIDEFLMLFEHIKW